MAYLQLIPKISFSLSTKNKDFFFSTFHVCDKIYNILATNVSAQPLVVTSDLTVDTEINQ